MYIVKRPQDEYLLYEVEFIRSEMGNGNRYNGIDFDYYVRQGTNGRNPSQSGRRQGVHLYSLKTFIFVRNNPA